MKKRQRLGQHFLISQSIAQKIVSSAKIAKNDVVLEIGTGRGILTPFLCKKAQKVISMENDEKLFQEIYPKLKKISNLELKNEDAFKSIYEFSILVSNLPYSQSRKALEWLIQKKFSHAVLMVQKEFSEKIFAKGKDRKSISLLVNYAAKVEKIMDVKKNNFSPAPKVNSTVIRLTRKKTVSKELIKTVNNLFSYRRKNLQNILKQFGIYVESKKRLDDLSDGEIIKIAQRIIKN